MRCFRYRNKTATLCGGGFEEGVDFLHYLSSGASRHAERHVIAGEFHRLVAFVGEPPGGAGADDSVGSGPDGEGRYGRLVRDPLDRR
jgi:hypothetical protein